MVYEKTEAAFGDDIFCYFQASFQQIRVLGNLPFQGHRLSQEEKKAACKLLPCQFFATGHPAKGVKKTQWISCVDLKLHNQEM